MLTSGADGTVRLGFGTFVDKVQSPMTQMTPYKFVALFTLSIKKNQVLLLKIISLHQTIFFKVVYISRF